MSDEQIECKWCHVPHGPLEEQVLRLRRELRIALDNNRQRNLELDGLHYVWCDGGCPGGVHRWRHKEPVTEEMVALAERNVKRLRTWFENHKLRVARGDNIFDGVD